MVNRDDPAACGCDNGRHGIAGVSDDLGPGAEPAIAVADPCRSFSPRSCRRARFRTGLRWACPLQPIPAAVRGWPFPES